MQARAIGHGSIGGIVMSHWSLSRGSSSYTSAGSALMRAGHPMHEPQSRNIELARIGADLAAVSEL